MNKMLVLTTTILCIILLSGCKEYTPEERALAVNDYNTSILLVQRDTARKSTAGIVYQLGQLAEERVEYVTAFEYYQQAAQLDPSNTDYQTALNRLSVIVKGSQIP